MILGNRECKGFSTSSPVIKKRLCSCVYVYPPDCGGAKANGVPEAVLRLRKRQNAEGANTGKDSDRRFGMPRQRFNRIVLPHFCRYRSRRRQGALSKIFWIDTYAMQEISESLHTHASIGCLLPKPTAPLKRSGAVERRQSLQTQKLPR